MMMNEYTVKNVKTFVGHDGQGFNASLYCNGKKVATVVDTAFGGPIDFHFDKREDEQAYIDFCKSQPQVECYGTMLDMDTDIYVSELVNTFLENKELKRRCKKNTLVVTKDCEKDSFYVYKVVFNENIKKQLEEKHGDDLVEIINERF